jgi:hypothetical protein
MAEWEKAHNNDGDAWANTIKAQGGTTRSTTAMDSRSGDAVELPGVWHVCDTRSNLLTRIGRGGSGSVRSRDRLVGQGDDMATERHHEASPH